MKTRAQTILDSAELRMDALLQALRAANPIALVDRFLVPNYEELARIEEQDWADAHALAEANGSKPRHVRQREQIREAWPDDYHRHRPLWGFWKRIRGR